MANMVKTVQASLNGKVYSRSVTITADGIVQVDPTLPAALAGTLSTKLDADTGIVTVASGHGIVISKPVHVYWTDPDDDVTIRCHRAMVDVVTATTVAFGYTPGTGSDSTGHGDALPPLDTVVQVMQHEEDFVVTGANVVGIGATMPQSGFAVFCLSDYTEVYAVDLRVYDAYVWTSDDGTTNPVTGSAIAKVVFSHNYTAGTVRATAAMLRS